MGVDLHGFRLLQYLAAREPLGDTATLGRQCIHVDPPLVGRLLGLPTPKDYGTYCENLLIEQFGASTVTSFDASDYEGALVLHDMNQPLRHDRQYDTVLDIGTLEHVFNLPTALSNVASICRQGGRIAHALPANNYSGHGFWQFSPELFFSLYSRENGFDETEVFIAEVTDEGHWWKSAVPKNGVRVEYTSSERSYILVTTRKVNATTGQHVQQSDYVVNWADGEAPASPPASAPFFRAFTHAALIRLPFLWRFAERASGTGNTHIASHLHRLSDRNPHFTRMAIEECLQGAAKAAGR